MAFPTTSVLDSGTAANENPVAGNWTGHIETLTIGSFQRLTNQFAQAASPGDEYWSASSFGANTEAFFTVPVLPAAGEEVRCYYRLDPINKNGYLFRVKNNAGSWQQQVFKVIAGVSTQIDGQVLAQTFSASDSLGISVTGTTHQLYYKASGGSFVTLGTSFVEATYTGTGNIGLGINGTTVRVTNFGGGTVVPAGTTYTPATGIVDVRGELIASWRVVLDENFPFIVLMH